MRHTNKILILALAVILMLSAASCSVNVYKKGVSDYSEYPDGDLPIYEDSVVYSYDYNEDREKVKLSFGSEDDIDDVIEFYQDFFADEEVNLISENEEKDEYSAEGQFADFSFELGIEEADGEESKYYNTVVDVEIDFSEQEDSATEAPTEEPAATPLPTEVPVEESNAQGLPITITAYGNTYVIDDVVVSTDASGNTSIIVTGLGFDVLPLRDGEFVIPVWCSVIAGSDEYEFTGITMGSPESTFEFDVSVTPDSVVFYPGDNVGNRSIVDLG